MLIFSTAVVIGTVGNTVISFTGAVEAIQAFLELFMIIVFILITTIMVVVIIIISECIPPFKCSAKSLITTM
jgi:hypothetical protein